MEAPYSSLAKVVEEMYGGYSVTTAISKGISIQKAKEELEKEGIDPWTGFRILKKEEVLNDKCKSIDFII